ncbi:hypothetical protein [Bergeyella sp. RCAD1439]|uniref:hypothetical protein n=1 Tax=Bergeyella anatis TaxID=3113737 RepID=UPI002E185B5F|nr:hypothetical protein [Bergeyella sp. RCAD1439]
MERGAKIMSILFFFLFIVSCSSDYKKEYKSKEDPDNSFIVETFDNRSKMITSMAYRNKITDSLYFLRVNDEFYQCDRTFLKQSTVKNAQFSTVKEYRIPRTLNAAHDRLIIKREGDAFVTINNMSGDGTVYLKYFYDKEYKILKIETMGVVYQ